MKNNWLEGYNKHEDELIEKYNQHPFFKQIDRVSEEVFKQYLLQLGHISMEFVKFLEIAKHGFINETSREAARHILRDEIPIEGPTHQDNRIYDLKMLGFSPSEILNTPASSQTKETLRGYYDLVKYPQDHQDIRILVAIRVIGEVLVGETYRHVVTQLVKRFGINPESSLFYTFHWQHDQKGGVGDAGGEGHTEYYDKALAELITSEEDLKVAKEAADKALQVRWDFHDQFFRD